VPIVSRSHSDRQPGEWAERPIAAESDRVDPRDVIEALVLAGGLVPLVAMITALFAAARIRDAVAARD
jgi:hypothetical protein